MRASAFALAVIAALTSQRIQAPERVDTIYKDAPVLTMNHSQPGTEAAPVEDGKILVVGRLSKMISHEGDSDEE